MSFWDNVRRAVLGPDDPPFGEVVLPALRAMRRQIPADARLRSVRDLDFHRLPLPAVTVDAQPGPDRLHPSTPQAVVANVAADRLQPDRTSKPCRRATAPTREVQSPPISNDHTEGAAAIFDPRTVLAPSLNRLPALIHAERLLECLHASGFCYGDKIKWDQMQVLYQRMCKEFGLLPYKWVGPLGVANQIRLLFNEYLGKHSVYKPYRTVYDEAGVRRRERCFIVPAKIPFTQLEEDAEPRSTPQRVRAAA